MKKFAFALFVLIVSLIFFTSCAPRELTAQADITALFEENKELILSSMEGGDLSEVEKISGIQHINVNEDGSYADFYCGGKGFGPETSYCGFFYSADDDMTALDGGICSAEDLSPSGQGYCWNETDGDNKYYVEPLGDHFFYYYLEF